MLEVGNQTCELLPPLIFLITIRFRLSKKLILACLEANFRDAIPQKENEKTGPKPDTELF